MGNFWVCEHIHGCGVMHTNPVGTEAPQRRTLPDITLHTSSSGSLFISFVMNQSVLQEINPKYSLEGLMLKLQYFGHLIQRVDSLEKTLMLGGIGGRRRRGRQWMRWHHWLYGRESEWTPGVGVGQGGLAWCDSWGRKESDTTERLIWSDKTCTYLAILLLEMCLSKNYVHMYQEISDYIYNNTTHNKSFWK